MNLKRDLLTLLEEDDEPLPKRLKIADSAFKSCDLPLQHKEAALINWLANIPIENNADLWKRFNDWVKTKNFKDLTRNDINNEEISRILEIITCAKLTPTDSTTETSMINTALELFNNRSFQQYFKFNCDVYCSFLSCVISKIHCLTNLKEFFKKISVKFISSEDGFVKTFLKNCIDGLVDCVKIFEDETVFALASSIVQKSIFYNCQPFTKFLDQFISDSKIQKHSKPYTLIKYLTTTYKECDDIETVKIVYKLIFHSFCKANAAHYDVIYKFLIILTHVIGFDSERTVSLEISKLQLVSHHLSLRGSVIFFELLSIINHMNIDPNFEVNGTNLKLFLQNILRDILDMKDLSPVSCKIITKCINIEPLIINDLIEDIIINIITYDNSDKQSVNERKHLVDDSIKNECLIHTTNIEKSDQGNTSSYKQEYVCLIVSIFDIYSKLHRFESLLNKIVTQFYNWCTEKKFTQNGDIYRCEGDLGISCTQDGVKGNKQDMGIVNNILIDAIMVKFSQCIETLASWQIINIFRTLHHNMKKVLEVIDTFEYGNSRFCVYVKLLSELLCTFMSSIRVSEHTVSSNTVEKTVKCLEELQDLLKNFARKLLNREHDPQLMRSFLNIAYHWGEIRLALAYYSPIECCQLNSAAISDAAACNLSYIHSYLDVQEWCLISERVKNFGEIPCKTLLQKMYVQKLRTIYLLEDPVTHDMIHDINTNVSMHIGDGWKYILSNKFIINNLLPEMDNKTITGLSRKVLHDIKDSFNRSPEEKGFDKRFDGHLIELICSSQLLLAAVSYVSISKINKSLLKYKGTIENGHTSNTFMSSKVSALIDEDIFLNRRCEKSGDDRVKKMFIALKEIYTNGIYENAKNSKHECAVEYNGDTFLNLLEVFKYFPTIYCKPQLQQICFVYFLTLHHDLDRNVLTRDRRLKENVEKIVFGLLQHSKFSLPDIVGLDTLLFQILNTFYNWKETFLIAAENIFKNEIAIKCLKDFIPKLCGNLLEPKHMSCANIILHSVSKLKKTKMSKETKNMANTYKQEICRKVLKLIEENKCITDVLFTGYTHVLKHIISQTTPLEKDDMVILEMYLQQYLDYAVEATDPQKSPNREKPEANDQFMSRIILFSTVLQNLPKFSSNVSKEGTVLKMWEASKDMVHFCSDLEEYGSLLVLIFTHIPNDEFTLVTKHLVDVSDMYIRAKNNPALSRHLLIWEYLISCNLNTVKTKMLIDALEHLVLKITNLFSGMVYDEHLFTSIYSLDKTLIQTNHHKLKIPIINLILLHPVYFMNNGNDDFEKSCTRALSLMSFLLKFRKPLMMDRLPVYLRQYRSILNAICEHGNTDSKLQEMEIRQISNCAHQLEKLTNSLVSCQKDISRISSYLISDILHQYEKFTLYTDVKIHLNNCIYSLISSCDQHAVAYLMRVLSNASTEMFKIMYDNYKKHYRFTGKV